MNALKVLWILCLCLVTAPLLAQSKDEEKITRDIITAKKKLIVVKNMNLTESEKKAFWPVYEQYQARLTKNNDRTVKLIEAYAKAYDNLTDQKAKSLLKEYLAIEEERLKLQKSFVTKFERVIPAKKVVRYYQVENKLDAIIDYELVDLIPLAK